MDGISRKSEVILYKTEDGKIKLEVRLENETAWLTQKMVADLFQVSVQTVNEHIKNIINEEELGLKATIRKFLIVQAEGARQVSRNVDFFNLDMILAVGYRVRSDRGTQFRQWATQRLNEYLVKGFTMDDERLKQGVNIGSDYFDEILERIRDIRSSEKRFYQKIRKNAGKIVKEVANNLALEQYERFNSNRLKQEAEVETLADDVEFKQIEEKIKKSSKDRKKRKANK